MSIPIVDYGRASIEHAKAKVTDPGSQLQGTSPSRVSPPDVLGLGELLPPRH